MHLGNVYSELKETKRNGTVIGRMAIDGATPIESSVTIDNVRAYKQQVIDLATKIASTKMKRADSELIQYELQIATEMAIFGCDLAIARSNLPLETVTIFLMTPKLFIQNSQLSTLPNSTKAELSSRLTELIPKYRKAWLNRNREGGLNDSCTRLQKTLNLLS